jgi:hypothetical protein
MNIHVCPLICNQPECPYRRPFGKQYELNRHIATAHGEARNYKCPIDTCVASLTGFAQKDKLVKHLQEEHDSVRCPYNHCFATIAATEEEKYVQEIHSRFECELMECANGGASRFSEAKLSRHLRCAHNMDHYYIMGILQYMELGNHKVVTFALPPVKTAKGIQRGRKNCVFCSTQHCANKLKQNS